MWYIANRLSINTDKTCCMLFTSRQKPEIISRIYLNDAINYQKRKFCTFVRSFLDNKLKFDLHIDHMYNKVSKSIGIFHKLKKT